LFTLNWLNFEGDEVLKVTFIARSSDNEADFDNGTFQFSAADGKSVDDVDVSLNSVASFVAQSKHTLTVHDVRKSDPRFPEGSLCIQVRIL